MTWFFKRSLLLRISLKNIIATNKTTKLCIKKTETSCAGTNLWFNHHKNNFKTLLELFQVKMPEFYHQPGCIETDGVNRDSGLEQGDTETKMTLAARARSLDSSRRSRSTQVGARNFHSTSSWSFKCEWDHKIIINHMASGILHKNGSQTYTGGKIRSQARSSVLWAPERHPHRP